MNEMEKLKPCPFCGGAAHADNPTFERSKDCPLVELPSHGRLIDADALLDALQKLFEEREKDAQFSGNKGAFIGWNDAIFKIKTAPTIIEAEEAED